MKTSINAQGKVVRSGRRATAAALNIAAATEAAASQPLDRSASDVTPWMKPGFGAALDSDSFVLEQQAREDLVQSMVTLHRSPSPEPVLSDASYEVRDLRKLAAAHHQDLVSNNDIAPVEKETKISLDDSSCLTKFIRSSWTQIALIGLVAFGTQGMWNALNALGGGGTSEVDLVTLSNVLVNVSFTIIGWASGGAVNLFGTRITITIGSFTCFLFIGSLYLYAYHRVGGAWMVPFFGLVDGIAQSTLWASIGTTLIFYPSEKHRGRALCVFFLLFNLGGVIGAILMVFSNMNASGEESAMSSASFAVVVGIVFAAVLISLFLCNPSKVIRSDRTKINLPKSQSPQEELRNLILAMTNRYTLLSFPFWIVTLWHEVFLYNWINHTFFTVKARGINSALYWSSRIFFSFILERLLDSLGKSLRTRGIRGFILLMCILFSAILCTFLIAAGITAAPEDGQRFNFTDKAAVAGILCFIFYGALDTLAQSLAMWIIGSLPVSDPGMIPRLSGLYRSFQAVGCAVSWLLDFHTLVPHTWQFLIACAIWLTALPGLIKIVFFELPDIVEERLEVSTSEMMNGDITAPGIAKYPSLGIMSLCSFVSPPAIAVLGREASWERKSAANRSNPSPLPSPVSKANA